jgi:mutual gliding-motility protein MglA
MVLISYSGREINAKLVYYGPGLSGKTTNLEYIYGAIPQTNRGKMVSMKTKTERTLFFDFLPIDLGELSGFKTRFLLYTVPGQVYYNATRKLVLKGVDAIVFVADSKRGKMDENIESLQNLRENLREHGLDVEKIPWVIQYNKRDLPDVYSIEELEKTLNPGRVPSFEAVGTTGVGVFETFKAVSRMLLKHLAQEIGVRVVPSAPGSQPNAAISPQPPAAPSPHAPAAPTIPVVAAAPQAIPLARPAPRPAPISSPHEDPEPAATPDSPESLRIERITPPPSRSTPKPIPLFVEAERIPPSDEAPADEEIEFVVEDGERAFASNVPSGPETDETTAEEAARRERMGDRLRRWFGRARDAEETGFTVELDVNREPVAPPNAPETSPEPIVTAEPALPAPVVDVARPEPRYREVPILVDLDPEDVERGVVLKLRICVRRASEPSEEGEGTQRWAA